MARFAVNKTVMRIEPRGWCPAECPKRWPKRCSRFRRPAVQRSMGAGLPRPHLPAADHDDREAMLNRWKMVRSSAGR